MPVAVEQRALDGQQLPVELSGDFGISFASDRLADGARSAVAAVAHVVGGGDDVGHSCRRPVRSSGAPARVDFRRELVDPRRIRFVVERNEVGVREPQRDESPQLHERDVIAETRDRRFARPSCDCRRSSDTRRTVRRTTDRRPARRGSSGTPCSPSRCRDGCRPGRRRIRSAARRARASRDRARAPPASGPTQDRGPPAPPPAITRFNAGTARHGELRPRRGAVDVQVRDGVRAQPRLVLLAPFRGGGQRELLGVPAREQNRSLRPPSARA